MRDSVPDPSLSQEPYWLNGGEVALAPPAKAGFALAINLFADPDRRPTTRRTGISYSASPWCWAGDPEQINGVGAQRLWSLQAAIEPDLSGRARLRQRAGRRNGTRNQWWTVAPAQR